jgi:hypothetical protein
MLPNAPSRLYQRLNPSKTHPSAVRRVHARALNTYVDKVDHALRSPTMAFNSCLDCLGLTPPPSPRPQNTHIFSPACLLCQDWKTWKSWLLSPVRAKNSCPRRCRHRGGVCAKRSWLRRRPPRETHQHASCKRSAWSKSTAFLTFDGCVCEDADAQLAMPCLLYRCKLQRRENILQVVSETLAKPHGCAP